MSHGKRITVLALGSIGIGAHAQTTCDCTTIVDACSATVTVEGGAVSIESDHGQCARVDYLIDGLPFVTLLMDGVEQHSRRGGAENPRVLMQSCQVCLAHTDSESPTAASARPSAEATLARADVAEEEAERTLAPLLLVNPEYPPGAASSSIEGFVDVRFNVTAEGLVEDASVALADPPGVFDRAALAAISRWRYAADEGRATVTMSHRFDFKADAAAIKSFARRASPETAIDALIARSASQQDGANAEAAVSEPGSVVRNQCIREQLAYDFGEMVEISLMNTCSEPLLVYSCAEGVGRYHLRWVCQSAENAQSILVRPGDRLVGNVAMIEVPQGVRTFRYAEDFFVARPRNTEYWWLACGVEDADCRGSGRQWARSMNGKASQIDPQAWTELRVARSN
jgi:protein TonB